MCGKQFSCSYYDNNILRNRLDNPSEHITDTHPASTVNSPSFVDSCRYLGLQVGYKVMGIVLLVILGWKAQRTREYSLEKSPEGLL